MITNEEKEEFAIRLICGCIALIELSIIALIYNEEFCVY